MAVRQGFGIGSWSREDLPPVAERAITLGSKHPEEVLSKMQGKVTEGLVKTLNSITTTRLQQAIEGCEERLPTPQAVLREVARQLNQQNSR